MKRQNVVMLIMVALVIGLMGSCDALFENQFKLAGLGQVAGEDLADSDAASLIEQSGLEGTGISESFIEAALSDPVVTAEILATLDAVANDPESPPEVVQAAEAIIIEIQLVESGGKEFIDNIVEAIATIDFETFDLSDPDTLSNLLAALFPARSLPAGWTQADIALVINSIYDLNDNFINLIDSIDESGLFVANGIDAGWLAQVGAMVTILHEVTPLYGAGVNPPNIGDSLAALIEFPEDYADYISFDPDTIADSILGNPNLLALFEAAGLDIEELMAGFGA